VNIRCASSVTAAIESHGLGVTAAGLVSNLTFNNCTDEWVVDVTNSGSLEFHSIGSGDGTITSSGMAITATRAGLSCLYRTEHTDIGTLTDSGSIYKEGPFEIYFAATVDIAANLPRVGGSFLCGGSTASWTGSYGVTNKPLTVDP
jgi:hypothetical protein